MLVVLSVTGITWHVWHEGQQTLSIGNWAAPLGIALHADGLTCVMLLMSATLGSFVTAYAWGYFGMTAADKPALSVSAECSPTPANQPDLFWPLWMLLWSALTALFLSGDGFNLYVTLELSTLTAIGMIVLAMIVLAGTRAAVEAALRYL